MERLGDAALCKVAAYSPDGGCLCVCVYISMVRGILIQYGLSLEISLFCCGGVAVVAAVSGLSRVGGVKGPVTWCRDHVHTPILPGAGTLRTLSLLFSGVRIEAQEEHIHSFMQFT